MNTIYDKIKISALQELEYTNLLKLYILRLDVCLSQILASKHFDFKYQNYLKSYNIINKQLSYVYNISKNDLKQHLDKMILRLETEVDAYLSNINKQIGYDLFVRVSVLKDIIETLL